MIVVNGRRDVVGNRIGEIEALMGSTRLGGAPSVEIADGAVRIGRGDAPPGGADVWLVRYDPRTVAVPIRRGENGGRTLPHTNVVHALERIGRWTGRAADFQAAAAGALRTAVLVQAPDGGPILGAATD